MLQKSYNDEGSEPILTGLGPHVIIKKNLCKACGMCIAFCPKKVIFKGEGISEMGYEYTIYCGEGCIGCGTCFYVCPEPGAITVIKK